MKKTIFAKASLMAFLIICLPISIPIVLATDPLVMPAEQCVDKYEEGNDFIDVMDNGIIRAIEGVASILYSISVVINTVDNIMTITGLLVGVQGPTPEATCCVNVLGELGVCESNYALFNTWNGIKNSQLLSGIVSIATCECCSGKSEGTAGGAGASQYFGGTGSLCPLGDGANMLGDVMGDSVLGVDYNNPNAGTGISQFHLSAFDNIYTAVGCLCPVAILHNLRKLKTIYQVHNCCVKEACKNGKSIEVCEHQLDEATCMYWEGSIARTLVTFLASILTGFVSNLFVQFFQETIWGKVSTCLLLANNMYNLPFKFQSINSAFEWVEYSFSSPTCSDLNFDDIDDMFDPRLNKNQRDLTMYENGEGTITDTFSYEPEKVEAGTKLDALRNKGGATGDVFKVTAKNGKIYYYDDGTGQYYNDLAQTIEPGLYEKAIEFESNKERKEYETNIASGIKPIQKFDTESNLVIDGKTYYLQKAESGSLFFRDIEGNEKSLSIEHIISDPNTYGLTSGVFKINGIEVKDTSIITTMESGVSIEDGSVINYIFHDGTSINSDSNKPLIITHPGGTIQIEDSVAFSSKLRDGDTTVLNAVLAAQNNGWSLSEIKESTNWNNDGFELTKDDVKQRIDPTNGEISYTPTWVDAEGLRLVQRFNSPIPEYQLNGQSIPKTIAESFGLQSGITNKDAFYGFKVSGNDITNNNDPDNQVTLTMEDLNDPTTISPPIGQKITIANSIGTISTFHKSGDGMIKRDGSNNLKGFYYTDIDGTEREISIIGKQLADGSIRQSILGRPVGHRQDEMQVNPQNIRELAQAASAFPETIDLDNVNYEGETYFSGDLDIISSSQFKIDGIAVQLETNRIMSFSGDGTNINQFTLKTTDSSMDKFSLTLTGNTGNTDGLSKLLVTSGGLISGDPPIGMIGTLTRSQEKNGINYQQLTAEIQDLGESGNSFPVIFYPRYVDSSMRSSVEATLTIDGRSLVILVTDDKVNIDAGLSGATIPYDALAQKLGIDINGLSQEDIKAAIGEKLKAGAEKTKEKANAILKGVTEASSKKIKDPTYMSHKAAQKVAYDLVWELLDFALAEWGFEYVDELCKEDWDASEPLDPNPGTTGGGGPPTTGNNQTGNQTGLPPGTSVVTGPCLANSYHAELREGPGGYRVTYSIMACTSMLRYEVYLKGIGRPNINVDDGYVAPRTIFTEDITVPGIIPGAYNEVCLEVDGQTTCF